MSDQAASVLDRVRNPQYTGENRCVPCTIVNAVLALVASALAWVVAIELAAAVFVCSVLAIYLRGYLVPGTPTLTKRYLPDWVLARFDTHPLEESQEEEPTWETVEKLERQRANAVDPEQFLLDVGAVGPCENEDDLCLTDEFADLVERRMEPLRDDPVDRERLADLFGTEPDAVTVEDREYPAIKIQRRIRKWPAEGALVADLATHRALRERTDRWADVPLEQRLDILEVLRSFHESCPLCSGELALSEGTVESCCRSYEVVALGCLDCGEPLLEFDPEEVAFHETDEGVRP